MNKMGFSSHLAIGFISFYHEVAIYIIIIFSHLDILIWNYSVQVQIWNVINFIYIHYIFGMFLS
jgi:hypothetical protein